MTKTTTVDMLLEVLAAHQTEALHWRGHSTVTCACGATWDVEHENADDALYWRARVERAEQRHQLAELLTALNEAGLLLPVGSTREVQYGYEMAGEVYGRTYRLDRAVEKLTEWRRIFPDKPAKLVHRETVSTPWSEVSDADA